MVVVLTSALTCLACSIDTSKYTHLVPRPCEPETQETGSQATYHCVASKSGTAPDPSREPPRHKRRIQKDPLQSSVNELSGLSPVLAEGSSSCVRLADRNVHADGPTNHGRMEKGRRASHHALRRPVDGRDKETAPKCGYPPELQVAQPTNWYEPCKGSKDILRHDYGGRGRGWVPTLRHRLSGGEVDFDFGV